MSSRALGAGPQGCAAGARGVAFRRGNDGAGPEGGQGLQDEVRLLGSGLRGALGRGACREASPWQVELARGSL